MTKLKKTLDGLYSIGDSLQDAANEISFSTEGLDELYYEITGSILPNLIHQLGEISTLREQARVVEFE